MGTVVGFRLVFERETGKPKGYGFCEYLDHETAQSAVRNLNGREVGGRPLRIDLADSDPMLEGRSTSYGELLEGDKRPSSDNNPDSWMSNLPQGAPIPPGKTSLDVITEALVSTKQNQLFEVIYDMKSFIAQHPDRARTLLAAHPQLVLAMLQALILHGVVDGSVLSRLQDNAHAKPSNPVLPPSNPSWPPSSTYYPPANLNPPAAPPVPTPGLDPQQQAMLVQVLSLTPEQINALPSGEREAILQLRSQFMPGS